jgi:hypothetical protein
MARGQRKIPAGGKPAKRKLARGGYAEGYVDAGGAFSAFEAVTDSFAGSPQVDYSISYDSGSSGGSYGGSTGSGSNPASAVSYDPSPSPSYDSGSSYGSSSGSSDSGSSYDSGSY